MRTSLLSAISHDLRTPLASITGSAGTLSSHWDRLDPQVREELLNSITSESGRLSRVLNNLLEVTRLEGGVRLRKDRFPLEEIVGAALHHMGPQIAGRPIQTDIPADLPMVEIDDVLMEQVFINLVENAIKYTPQDSPVEIAARSRNGFVEVEVRDRGPGFAPGHEGRIFDKFFRGGGHEARGSGLGLAICRAIVEAHGGSIQAESRPEGGAVIRFQILREDTADLSRPISGART
jgi:two-component system sensor histidine kinase KdpD